MIECLSIIKVRKNLWDWLLFLQHSNSLRHQIKQRVARHMWEFYHTRGKNCIDIVRKPEWRANGETESTGRRTQRECERQERVGEREEKRGSTLWSFTREIWLLRALGFCISCRRWKTAPVFVRVCYCTVSFEELIRGSIR